MSRCRLYRFFFPKKHVVEVSACEDLSHEIRNAVLGIQLERRKLWKAMESYDLRVKAHLTRIEVALKEYGRDS